MQERIQGLRQSVAGVSQSLKAPRTWLGSEEVNVLQVLCDLLDLIGDMNTQLASHTHLPGPKPATVDASSFMEKAMVATRLSKLMEEIKF
jgi:hypothetical protein